MCLHVQEIGLKTWREFRIDWTKQQGLEDGEEDDIDDWQLVAQGIN